jgi:hypothetical protein
LKLREVWGDFMNFVLKLRGGKSPEESDQGVVGGPWGADKSYGLGLGPLFVVP